MYEGLATVPKRNMLGDVCVDQGMAAPLQGMAALIACFYLKYRTAGRMSQPRDPAAVRHKTVDSPSIVEGPSTSMWYHNSPYAQVDRLQVYVTSSSRQDQPSTMRPSCTHGSRRAELPSKVTGKSTTGSCRWSGQGLLL